MNLAPRDYQQRGIDLGLAAARDRNPRRLLLAAPTAAGKSICEVAWLNAIPDSILVSPSHEIIDGLEDKGAPRSRMWTPVTLRNRLLDGSVAPPRVVIFNETHHSEAETWQQIAMSCDAIELGLTATPYRGTPKGTVAFRLYWGDPVWLIDYPTAIASGYITLPSCTIEPLVDDDLITVTASGEFDVQSIADVTGSKIGDFARLVSRYPLDKPTMLTLPSRETCRLVAEHREFKHPYRIVDGDTPRDARREAFAATLRCECVLIQIAVVSEGVDLAIRRLIDAAPTMSPVRWVQLIGRAMRPGAASEYIGTNRNLLRHAYAIQGVMPTQTLVEAQNAFLGSSARDGLRVVGLEGLGRFKANDVMLANGLEATMYQVEARDEGTGGIRQYTCIVHPASADPLWATRVNNAGAYGRWQRCDAPVGLVGFASGRASAISDKQRNWWCRDAAKFGLDPSPELVTRRTFAILPVLADIKAKVV